MLTTSVEEERRRERGVGKGGGEMSKPATSFIPIPYLLTCGEGKRREKKTRRGRKRRGRGPCRRSAPVSAVSMKGRKG